MLRAYNCLNSLKLPRILTFNCHNTAGVRNIKLVVESADSEEETIFDQIISREVKADIIHEDEDCLAFYDPTPKAPTHFLVIPKVKITQLDAANEEHQNLLGKLLLVASRLAKERLEKGYRIVINNGDHAGESVNYLHINVIGGCQLEWSPM